MFVNICLTLFNPRKQSTEFSVFFLPPFPFLVWYHKLYKNSLPWGFPVIASVMFTVRPARMHVMSGAVCLSVMFTLCYQVIIACLTLFASMLGIMTSLAYGVYQVYRPDTKLESELMRRNVTEVSSDVCS